MDPLSKITIQRADPGDMAARTLIQAHLAHSCATTPQASNHTMGVQALKGPDIRFWTLGDATGALGCGALKSLPDGTCEVKSVHIAKAARRRGLARRMMAFLIETARNDAAGALVLETGTMQEFSAARGLYEALGFTYCDPIPGYGPDPNSAFMRLGLDPAGQSPQKGHQRSRSSTG